jgi:hypothetical protein
MRLLAILGGWLAAAGLVLGVGRDGEGIWPDGRLLLIAGGVLFLVYAAWAPRQRTPADKLPASKEAIGAALVGVGLIGGGVDHLDPDGPWLLLCAPIGLGLLWFAWWVGEHDHGDWKGQAALAVFGLAALALAASELI